MISGGGIKNRRAGMAPEKTRINTFRRRERAVQAQGKARSAAAGLRRLRRVIRSTTPDRRTNPEQDGKDRNRRLAEWLPVREAGNRSRRIPHPEYGRLSVQSSVRVQIHDRAYILCAQSVPMEFPCVKCCCPRRWRRK